MNIEDDNSRVETQTANGCASAVPSNSNSKQTADRPHWVTILLGSLSPTLAIVALAIAWGSLSTSRRAMKVSQRAYLTYEVTITNGSQVVESVRNDKDFFLTYQFRITNMGSTPAGPIYPKVNVMPDPDRAPVMITFPSQQPFDLGPRESRIVIGQALFKHFRNVRGLPGFTTGFTGQIEYKDVFGDSQVRPVCYQFLVSGGAASGGLCGTVMQMLDLK